LDNAKRPLGTPEGHFVLYNEIGDKNTD